MFVPVSRAVFLTSLLLCFASESLAETFPFTGTLEIKASVGTSPSSFELVSVAVSGTADITGGVVMIPAGAISVPIPAASGFSGTVVNGAASFVAAGVGAGSTCPLIDIQEICIPGGGFGGAMLLANVLQAGQPLVVWGTGGSNLGTTTNAGVVRLESARLWTTGSAAAWFYIPESDPTPFTLTEAGSFRGLPSTFTGAGAAGFSVVTPMMVTSDMPAVSLHNIRGVAKLQINFNTPTLPTGGAGVLAILLGGVGMLQLIRRRAVSSA